MADFQSQAMGLTGLTIDGSSTTPSRAEFSTFLNDGVADVTSRWLAIRPQDLDDFLRESSEQTSNGFNPGTNKIISVIRESGTNNEWYPCNKESISLQYRVTDPTSLHYASKFNPVYMISQNRNIHVFPAPSSAGNDTFKVLYVNSSPEETDGSALDHASTGIKWFPEDKVYLVVLYASIRSIQAKMADTTISNLSISAVPPDVPSLVSVTFNSIDSDIDSAIGSFFTAATIGSASTYTGSAPNYSKLGSTALSGVTAFNSYWTLGDFGDSDPGALSVNAVAPDVPSLSTVTFASTDTDLDASLPTYTFSAAAAGGIFGSVSSPDYTVKTVTSQTTFNDFFESGSKNPFDDSDPSTFSISAVAPDVPTIASVAYAAASNADASATGVTSATASEMILIDVSGSAPSYTPPTQTISGVNWATEYPSRVSDITTALGLVKAAVDQAETAGDRFASATSDSQYDTNATWDATNSQLTRVKNALDQASDLINGNQPSTTTDAFGAQADEDPELVSSALAIAQTEIKRAQAHIQEWTSIGDMRVKEIQAALQEADGYAKEVQALLAATPVKVQEFQAKVGDALNTFNRGNAVYQMEFQEAVTKENQDLQIAIANANNLAQEYRQEAKQTTEIDQFNKQQDQALNLENAVKAMEDDIADNNSKVQKYQAELTSYGAEVNAEVQEYQQKLQRYTIEMNTAYQAWAKTESDNIQKFQLDTQNELNDFNAKNVLFQANIQESMQELQVQNQVNIASAQGELQKNIDNENRSQARQLQNGVNDMKAIFDNNTQLIAKYQAELSSYGAEVNTEVQEYGQKLARYQAELSTVQQAWAKTESDRLAALQVDIQDELNDISAQDKLYQSAIQESMAEAQFTNQVNIAKAQADIQLRIRNEDRSQERVFQNALNDMKAIFDNNAELIQKYQTEVATYQAEVAAEVQEYTQNLQGDGMGYQWLQDQYTRLKAEYDQAFMIAAPKQQEGAEA